MNSTLKSLLFWMVLVVVGVLIWNFSTNFNQRDSEITFSEFMRKVDQGQVASVVITGNEVTGTYKRTKNIFDQLVISSFLQVVAELPLGKRGIGASDCHSTNGVGYFTTVFEHEIRNQAHMLELLHARRFYAAQGLSTGNFRPFVEELQEPVRRDAVRRPLPGRSCPWLVVLSPGRLQAPHQGMFGGSGWRPRAARPGFGPASRSSSASRSGWRPSCRISSAPAARSGR